MIHMAPSVMNIDREVNSSKDVQPTQEHISTFGKSLQELQNNKGSDNNIESVQLQYNHFDGNGQEREVLNNETQDHQ